MPWFRRLKLERIDLTGASLPYATFSRCTLGDVKFDRASLRDVGFNKGTVERCSFRDTDLRGTVWGFRGRVGPTVVGCDFVDARARAHTATFCSRIADSRVASWTRSSFEAPGSKTALSLARSRMSGFESDTTIRTRSSPGSGTR